MVLARNAFHAPSTAPLAIHCYTNYSSTAPLIIKEYSGKTDQLSFTTLAPGGFGTLSMRVHMANPWIPRPELAMFSKICLFSGDSVIWLGEITEPKIGMDESGDYINITALGIGNCLRDDANANSYTGQTGQAIFQSRLNVSLVGTSEFSNNLSTDYSAIFPDAPAATFTVAYDNRTIEEIFNDVTLLEGDYTWGVWEDPNWQTNSARRDTSNYPLGRVEAHSRDTSTTHYTASIQQRDVVGFEGGPSADRAYNHVEVGYSDSNGYNKQRYLDARLTPVTLAQGSAPFRYRKLLRDLTGIQTVNATQALAIANAFGVQMKDPTNKWTFRLRRIRNAYGQEIPLWMVRADRNLYIPGLAPRGSTLPTTATAGVNQFYIVQTSYSEDASGPFLEVQCDNYADLIETRIARLQLQADNKARSGKTTGGMVATGTAISGVCSVGQSGSTAGNPTWGSVSFAPSSLYQAPTSISFNTISATNMSGVAATDLRATGFSFSANSTAGGNCNARFTYTTNGNCIRAIRRTQLDWHCDSCGKEFRGLSVARDVRVVVYDDLPERIRYQPGHTGLAIDCPECALTDHPHTESFNTALLAIDEDHTRPGNHHHRAEQAQLIRKLMRHGAVGLETLA